MSDGNNPKDYEVGYGKPPKNGQFKKGRSGNPKGRPKGSKNLKTDVLSVLNSRITVNEGGRTRKVSAQLAMLKRLQEKALNGDLRALEKLLEFAHQFNNEENPEVKEAVMSSDDVSILEAFKRRLQNQDGDKGDVNTQDEGSDDDELGI